MKNYITKHNFINYRISSMKLGFFISIIENYIKGLEHE